MKFDSKLEKFNIEKLDINDEKLNSKTENEQFD